MQCDGFLFVCYIVKLNKMQCIGLYFNDELWHLPTPDFRYMPQDSVQYRNYLSFSVNFRKFC